MNTPIRQWETGHVTTFKQEEVKVMKELLSQTPDEILQAGIHPTFDMIETYAYHLPNASLANLVDIFISLSTVDDSLYSLCHMKDRVESDPLLPMNQEFDFKRNCVK